MIADLHPAHRQLAAVDPAMAKFESDHVYSTAHEATTKRQIDLQIIGGDYARGGEISLTSPRYLKRLIELASNGKTSVGTASAMQFFIVKGGAEGFLPAFLRGQDASSVVESDGSTTQGAGSTFHFDHNDLLVVFDSLGLLVGAARLERPTFITGIWSRKTADKVYAAWDGKTVFIYRNTSFDIPYVGLGVDDGFRGRAATVDLHKQEATNGCIFVVDPNTPDIDDKALETFEPKLIKDILASIGKSTTAVRGKRITLGKMRVIDIR